MRQETEGTKIGDILKRMVCKECGNNKIDKFEFVFEMNPNTKKVFCYLCCLECNKMYRYDMKLQKIIVDGIFMGD